MDADLWPQIRMLAAVPGTPMSMRRLLVRTAARWILSFLFLTATLNAAMANTVTVNVYNFMFSTGSASGPQTNPTINVGDTIKWVWQSGTHSTTSVKGSGITWDSGLKSGSATFSQTFNSAGTYVYYCSLHGRDSGNGSATGMAAKIFVVKAPSLTSMTITPNPVVATASATGTLTVDSTAPSGGASIALTSDNAAAKVPSTVTMAANASTATFTITTTAVTAAATANIKATLNGTSQSVVFKVRLPGASKLAFSPTSIASGKTSTGTVTLEAAPAADTKVALSITSGSAAIKSFPSSVTVKKGATTATFTVTAATVSSNTTAKFQATANTISATGSLTVTH
jgi:plastocyanin